MILKAEGRFGKHISVAGDMSYPAYVIAGSKANVMVDAGLNCCGPLYLRSLDAILGDRQRLDMVFLTHSHYDHLGAVPYLRRTIPALKIGAHPYIETLLKKQSVLDRMTALGDIQRAAYADSVGDADVRLEPVVLDYRLSDGDSFDLGGLTFVAYETPGHTRDSMSYYIPEERALFAGEAIGVPQGFDALKPQVEFLSSYSDYLSSIERLIDLHPRMIGMAHGTVFTDDDAIRYLDDTLAETEKYRKLIESYLDRNGGDIERTIDEMVKKEYDEPGNIFQERNAYLLNLRAQVEMIASFSKSNIL